MIKNIFHQFTDLKTVNQTKIEDLFNFKLSVWKETSLGIDS